MNLAIFDPAQKVIEYKIKGGLSKRLVSMTLDKFTEEVASESPAPGGGSVAAYIASTGIALATMVANLSSHKRGWMIAGNTFPIGQKKGKPFVVN